MIEIKGKVNTAICYAAVVEDEAIEQIRRMCDHDFTAGSQIRIMPDVHAGKGCTIGTTMTISDKAVPNIVGVDIGCGMYTVELGKVDIDFEKVDAAAHYIPSGRNVEAVFDLILDAAVRGNVPQEELPETLYLISDMEFNACVQNASVSNFASAKRRFAEHGYKLPQIVFWNVASRNSNQPVTKNEQGAALVSGCTPRLFSMVASGDLSPYSAMMEIIESERYAKISA